MSGLQLSQCHGLSGLGEIYLEAGRVLGDDKFHRNAEEILRVLLHLGKENDDGAMTWLVEDPHAPTADLMAGCSGVVHFLLRCSLPEERIGLPLLLDSTYGSRFLHGPRGTRSSDAAGPCAFWTS